MQARILPMLRHLMPSSFQTVLDHTNILFTKLLVRYGTGIRNLSFDMRRCIYLLQQRTNGLYRRSKATYRRAAPPSVSWWTELASLSSAAWSSTANTATNCSSFRQEFRKLHRYGDHSQGPWGSPVQRFSLIPYYQGHVPVPTYLNNRCTRTINRIDHTLCVYTTYHFGPMRTLYGSAVPSENILTFIQKIS